MKNQQIFDNINKKTSTTLFDFKKKLIFEGFFTTNQKTNSSKSNDITINNPRLVKISKFQSDCILKPITKAKKRESFRQK